MKAKVRFFSRVLKVGHFEIASQNSLIIFHIMLKVLTKMIITGGKRKTKRDVSRLLKIALDVDMSEEKIGDVNKVFIEQEKSYTSL